MKRRKQFNRGKWMVARERFGIVEFNPDNKREDAIAVGSAISALMKKLGIEDNLRMRHIEDDWADIVGGAVAQHTRPGKLEGGNLVVFVDSSVWLSELSRYGRDDMLANLRQKFGDRKIKSISLQPDPG
ncbi:MAG: DUF721 domain-containing protein [Lentisphaerae bacterium]|nr:DUF721 domain-containing protein [Lentisphaerota bacterium]